MTAMPTAQTWAVVCLGTRRQAFGDRLRTCSHDRRTGDAGFIRQRRLSVSPEGLGGPSQRDVLQVLAVRRE
jgi:hypothetical protein